MQQLATLLTLIILGVVAGVSATILAAVNAWLAKINSYKLDNNTKETVEAKEAAKKANEKAVATATIATSAVIENKEKQAEVLEHTTKIEESLNGGTGGLKNLHERVMKLEASHQLTQQGQVKMSSAIDQLVLEMADLNRTLRTQPPGPIKEQAS